MVAKSWTFLTSYGAILLYVAGRPTAAPEAIQEALGLSAPTVARVLRNLRESGYLEPSKRGDMDYYAIRPDLPLRRIPFNRVRLSELFLYGFPSTSPSVGNDVVTQSGDKERWTILTSHGAVFLYVVDHPEATIRQISDATALSERAVASILGDLAEGSYISKSKIGRRNVYQVHANLPLRQKYFRRLQLSEVFAPLSRSKGRTAATQAE